MRYDYLKLRKGTNSVERNSLQKVYEKKDPEYIFDMPMVPLTSFQPEIPEHCLPQMNKK